LLKTFKNIQFIESDIQIKVDNGKVFFSSDTFVWGIAIDNNGESNVQDNCFDILSGIPY